MMRLMKLAQAVGCTLWVVMGCCFSTPKEETMKGHPYLEFNI
ncbi:hypothetical protein ES703_81334 [subsurface metagenome]